MTDVLQALTLPGKGVFRNCLVSMCPQATCNDVPSTHDVTTYIHNEFVKFMQELKQSIMVSKIDIKYHITHAN